MIAPVLPFYLARPGKTAGVLASGSLTGGCAAVHEVAMRAPPTSTGGSIGLGRGAKSSVYVADTPATRMPDSKAAIIG